MAFKRVIIRRVGPLFWLLALIYTGASLKKIISLALLLIAAAYTVVTIWSFIVGGFSVVYLTESTFGLSINEHVVINRTLYTLLSVGLLSASYLYSRHCRKASTVLLFTLPIMFSDGGSALFDLFSHILQIKLSDHSFNYIYNELRVTEILWYIFMAVVSAAIIYGFMQHRVSALTPSLPVSPES